MPIMFRGRESGIEVFRVQVGDTHSVPSPSERAHHAVAYRSDVRLGVGMAIHDECSHRSRAIRCSTRWRNRARSSGTDASTPYIATQVERACQPHDIRSARVIVRLPLSLIAATYVRPDPYVLMPTSRRTCPRP